MNERIFELAKQAGLISAFSAALYRPDIEHFAKLIVRECIVMADEFELDVNRAGLVDRIKEHFGVEE